MAHVPLHDLDAPRAIAAPLTAPATQRYARIEVLTRGAGIGAAYFASAKLGLALAVLNPSVTAVWPPSGVAVAAFAVAGFRYWPAIFAGAFLVNITIDGHPLACTAIALGNTLEALAGAWVIRRWAGGPAGLERPRGVLCFALLAVSGATVIAATVGTASLVLAGRAAAADAPALWLTWWLGDAVGVLVMTPVIVLWSARPRLELDTGRLAELGLVSTMLVAAGCLVFLHGRAYPLTWSCLPPLIWVAYRFGAREAASGTLLVGALAVSGASRGAGPFARLTPHESLLLVQAFVGATALTTLMLSAVLAQRRRVHQELDHKREQLEQRVRGRTDELSQAVEALALEIQSRHRIELDLRESERGLAEAQALARLGSWSWDLPSGAVSLSAEMHRLLGLPRSPQPLTFAALLARVHPDERATFATAIDRAVLDGQPFSLDHRVQLADRAPCWLHARGEVALDAAGRPARLFGTAADVTDRKLAEEALRESEERFRSVAQAANEGVILCDGAGLIVWWNEAARRIFGCAAEAARGRPFTAFLPRRFHEIHRRIVESVQDTGRHRLLGRTMELCGLREDGSETPIELSLTAWTSRGQTFHGGIVRDIAERQRAETKFRGFLDSAPDAMVIAHDSGEIVLVNTQVERVFGYAREELLGQSIELLVPDRFREAHAKHRPPTSAGLELYGRRKDGSRFPVEVRFSPLETEDGLLISSAIRDITERNRAEEQIRRLNVELEQRVEERTAALRRSNEELRLFAHVASHDLQEPLRMVSSFVQLLAERYRGRIDEDADEFINFAVDGARRMHELINALLAYSRLDKAEAVFSPVDCGLALGLALRNLQLVIRESGAVVTHGPLPRIEGDATQIVQLLQNLLGNAIKFRRAGTPPRIAIDAEPAGADWLFTVQDNGIGIDPQYAERIFIIFQRLQAHGESSGTGLGLAICKKIVERHHGRIWVESRRGAGSAFRFTLPQTPRGEGEA